MRKTSSRRAWIATGVAALALSGCGGGGGHSGSSGSGGGAPPPSPPPPPPAMGYAETKLVSDQAGVALSTDPNLVDAWGLAFGTEPAWVNDNGTNKSTVYDGNGAVLSVVESIPPGAAGASNPTGGTANPTGIVFNGTNNFVITQNGVTGPAKFLYVGEEGTLSGSFVSSGTAVTVYDGSTNGDVYKGLAIYTQGGVNLLLAANFHTGKVDVFDTSFHKTTVSGGFTDPNLPAGYAPFNVQTIGSLIYVAYAKQDAQGFNEVDGAGLGVVDAFDATGTLVKRISSGGALNAPWGLALAPSNFGQFSGDLLVGNFGDGKINVFDPNTGAMVGTLSDKNGAAIVIDGLWALEFGNGQNNQPTNTLFFTAGPNQETHGLYGRLDVTGTYTPPASTPPASPPPPAPPPPPPPAPPPPPGY